MIFDGLMRPTCSRTQTSRLESTIADVRSEGKTLLSRMEAERVDAAARESDLRVQIEDLRRARSASPSQLHDYAALEENFKETTRNLKVSRGETGTRQFEVIP